MYDGRELQHAQHQRKIACEDEDLNPPRLPGRHAPMQKYKCQDDSVQDQEVPHRHHPLDDIIRLIVVSHTSQNFWCKVKKIF
jgi:hypothetical protein